MPVSISGNGTFAGLTSVETVNVLHPDASVNNLVLADDGSVALDSIPASIQFELDELDSAIDNIPVLAGIGSNVVQTVKTDVFATTSDAFTAVTGLGVSITPTSASAKILVIATVQVGQNAQDRHVALRLNGGNASNFVGNADGSRPRTVWGQVRGASFQTDRGMHAVTMIYLDSPATTSSVTYNVDIKRGSPATVYVNRTGLDANNSDWPRGASSIIAIEVAA